MTDDVPSLKFYPDRLSKIEKVAWSAQVKRAGNEFVAAMFEYIAEWVLRLSHEGKPAAEIRDEVMGSFYDNIDLMKLGRTVRNESIILTKGMAEQVLDALCA